ncbi:MAG: hypothetical protein AB8C84_00135 [Oligoflexales bacterium]
MKQVLLLVLALFSHKVCAVDLDADYGVEVYIVETLLQSLGSSGGGEFGGRYLNHQGLRFVGKEGVVKEAHFGMKGLTICDEGKYGVRVTDLKRVGEIDKTVGQCVRWCKRWSKNRPYFVNGVCWNMVTAFLDDHETEHPAADKGKCQIM